MSTAPMQLGTRGWGACMGCPGHVKGWKWQGGPWLPYEGCCPENNSSLLPPAKENSAASVVSRGALLQASQVLTGLISISHALQTSASCCRLGCTRKGLCANTSPRALSALVKPSHRHAHQQPPPAQVPSLRVLVWLSSLERDKYYGTSAVSFGTSELPL